VRMPVLRIAVTTAVVAGACVTGVAGAASAPAGMVDAHGSARQVYATDLPRGANVELVDSAGKVVATKQADAQGGLLFRDVEPGTGYRVRLSSTRAMSTPVTVRSEDPAPWDPKLYEQEIPSQGYGYLTTRDGTQLAYTVHPPTKPAGQPVPEHPVPAAGAPFTPPYPTLIEYSGYGYANPDGPQSGIAVLANLMGFAVVDIQMRGTGCSGGAFDFFEPLQSLDGYDIVETVARQPWVKGGKVGMMGISYGGISQLFTAALRPPSLAAITPLSVLDATATTLYPGGLRNDGFAVAWAKERQHEALPAGPDAGQPYAWQRIQDGDEVCEQNQELHGQAADLMKKIEENSHYVPAVADPLDPITFVDKIDVPVFLACQWQDEQTGGHCPALASRFTGTKKKWFTFTNGPHIDSLAPETYNRWYDFLQLFVAEQAPIQNSAITRAAAPVVFQAAMGLPQDEPITLPVDPVQLQPTYDLALAEFEKQPQVRVLFDHGAGTSPTGSTTAGNPYPGFEQSFDAWPIPATKAQRWYLGAGGELGDRAPARRAVESFTASAKALPLTNHGKSTGGGGLWGNASQWQWDWKPNPTGTAVSYVTPPLKEDTTVVGAGAVYLWVKSSTPDVDLQATITEVSEEGNETFVQNGYLRASMRKLSTDTNNVMKTPSTLLEPQLSMLKSDVRPMPRGEFVELAIPLYYSGHAYRAGSRIRVTIAAPNGAQPVWSFSGTAPAGTAQVAVAMSPKTPSSLVLPVVPGVEVPTEQPACPSLRNQPCREYVALKNRAEKG
jgi:predicted acyl esterase